MRYCLLGTEIWIKILPGHNWNYVYVAFLVLRLCNIFFLFLAHKSPSEIFPFPPGTLCVFMLLWCLLKTIISSGFTILFNNGTLLSLNHFIMSLFLKFTWVAYLSPHYDR